LHLPPQLPNFLFLIIIGKDFAETLERNYFRWQFISPQDWLKRGGGPRHQAKPQIPGKRRAGIPQFVLAVKFPHRFHCRALLLAPGPVLPQVTPSPRTIHTAPSVVEVFSCLLPQSSLRPVDVSISA